jgi:hypothetical protein
VRLRTRRRRKKEEAAVSRRRRREKGKKRKKDALAVLFLQALHSNDCFFKLAMAVRPQLFVRRG